MKGTRQRRKLGGVVKIDLGDGYHNYARILQEPLFAFYEGASRNDIPIDEIVKKPILFQVWVMNRSISTGRWRILGVIPLDGRLENAEARFFNQDLLDASRCSIVSTGSTEKECSCSECVGLEAAAVWAPEHVEDRLRDHYRGVPNKWVESLKLKL